MGVGTDNFLNGTQPWSHDKEPDKLQCNDLYHCALAREKLPFDSHRYQISTKAKHQYQREMSELFIKYLTLQALRSSVV